MRLSDRKTSEFSRIFVVLITSPYGAASTYIRTIKLLQSALGLSAHKRKIIMCKVQSFAVHWIHTLGTK